MKAYKTFVRMVFNRGTLWEDNDTVPYSDIEHQYLARAKWECNKAKKQGYDAYIKAYDVKDESDYNIVKEGELC